LIAYKQNFWYWYIWVYQFRNLLCTYISYVYRKQQI